jgi:cell division protein YceG involved in septum cleavage
MASIDAALSPEKTEYLYFIVGTVPPYEAKYSLTFKEHNDFWQANKDRLTGK